MFRENWQRGLNMCVCVYVRVCVCLFVDARVVLIFFSSAQMDEARELYSSLSALRSLVERVQSADFGRESVASAGSLLDGAVSAAVEMPSEPFLYAMLCVCVCMCVCVYVCLWMRVWF